MRPREEQSAYITAIHQLGGSALKKPITVLVEVLDKDEYLASFPEANIAIAGELAKGRDICTQGRNDLATFELYRREMRLGPEPRRRLEVLEAYLGQEGRK